MLATLFFKKEHVHDMVYNVNKSESHRSKVCTHQEPRKTMQGATYHVFFTQVNFCQQGFLPLNTLQICGVNQ